VSGGWSEGYVVDVEYAAGFYGELAPAHLDLVCLLNGVEPPRHDGAFAYGELGCGQGLTAAVIAAANPAAEVVGVDFNPAHIARARALAAAAGLANLDLRERSFEALAEEAAGDGARFDYVVLHGVYSWVADAQRRAIVRFLDVALKPGGVAFVSYNALPGWTAALPVQHLLRGFAAEARGTSADRIEQATAAVRRAADAGSPYLQDNPFLQRVERARAAGARDYLAHEYLTPHWAPMSHAEVADDLADAKLDFVGSTSVARTFPELTLKLEQRALRDEIADPRLRETFKDFFTTASFRSDAFVRGRRRLAPEDRDARLAATALLPTAPAEEVRLGLDMPVGRVTLPEQVYTPMLRALADGPRTVAELRALPELEGRRVGAPVEIAGMLVAVGAAAPAPGANAAARGPASADRAPARRLNLHNAERARGVGGGPPGAVAAPRLASGLPASPLELTVLAALFEEGEADPAALTEAVWAPIRDRGEALVEGGATIEGEAESRALVRRRVDAVLAHKLPLWRRLGVLGDAAAPPGRTYELRKQWGEP
jgi:SAM-dependent methyltransferase